MASPVLIFLYFFTAWEDGAVVDPSHEHKIWANMEEYKTRATLNAAKPSATLDR